MLISAFTVHMTKTSLAFCRIWSRWFLLNLCAAIPEFPFFVPLSTLQIPSLYALRQLNFLFIRVLQVQNLWLSPLRLFARVFWIRPLVQVWSWNRAFLREKSLQGELQNMPQPNSWSFSVTSPELSWRLAGISLSRLELSQYLPVSWTWGHPPNNPFHWVNYCF